MRAPHFNVGGVRRLASILSVIGAAWLLSSVPAAADSASDGSSSGNEASAKAAPSGGDVQAASVSSVSSDAAAPSARDDDSDSADEKVEKPRRKIQSKPRRGGIHPCMTPDTGFGIYDRWSSAPSIGQMIMPHKGGITKTGGFDLVVHFHGHEPIRKEFVKTAKGPVLVGIDLGIGSGAYSKTFSAPYVFTNLLKSVEAGMAQHTGNKNAHIRKLALSSWSAGYGAIEQILRQPASKKVDAVILLDSLHVGYVDEQARSLKVEMIEPFVAFAKRAAAKKSFMFMSHSSIIPPGYASTAETAGYVVKELKGKPKKATRQDVLGLDLYERFDKGNFRMRGYTGNDKPDHCAHIGLMADIMRVHLGNRWKSPRGKL